MYLNEVETLFSRQERNYDRGPNDVDLAFVSPINISERHDTQFPLWVARWVKQLYVEGKCTNELMSLAHGLDCRIRRYPGCNIISFRFHTKGREKDSRIQNSGIVVCREHDNREIDFYGVMRDIIKTGEGKNHFV